MPTEEVIRNLCLRVSLAQGDEEFTKRLDELRTVMRKHFEDTQNLGIHLILSKPGVTAKDGTND